MIVPHEAISDDALQNLIEAHVLQEGTDYGHKEMDLQTKCRQVRQALFSGEACVVFDPNTQSTGIRLKSDLDTQK